MQAKVETALDGGTVEIVYTTDPKCIDGLTLGETVDTVLGLIPALLYATTHITVDETYLAEIYRDKADIYDPPEKHEYVVVRTLMGEEETHPIDGYSWEDEH